MKKINRLIKKISSVDVVSFDIFDTLIKRNVSHPHDVFDIVQQRYNSTTNDSISNFKTFRINAEKKCRLKLNKEEISITDIYNQLEKVYSKKMIQQLINIEKEVEIDICQFNSEIINIYDWCKKNKKIIITSDMYLDKMTIEKILKKNNIKYDKLYLSSDIMLTKCSGNLFDYIIQDLNICSTKIIHIGDNYKSDYISPRRHKILSFNWKNECNCSQPKNITYNILSNFNINNYNRNDNFATEFGFNCFGPLLLCFSKWLLMNLKNNKIKKVFFMARDGYIMKEAFDKINDDNTIESYYFYASRRSIIVPSLYKCKNIEEVFSKMFINNTITIKSLLKKIGLDDLIDKTNFVKKYGINIEDKYEFATLLNEKKIKFMFDDLFPQIINNSKMEFESFKIYSKKMNFSGKVAIVDIGWFGNMQHSIEMLNLDLDLYGYYMGIEPRKNYQKLHKMFGFLFDSNFGYESFLKEHNFNSIFEMLFLAQHGSVKRFNKNKKEMVEFYNYEYDNLKDLDKIRLIQESAIEYVDKFKKSSLIKYLENDLTSCFDFISKIMLSPTIREAKFFGDFEFLDDEKKYIAKPRKRYNYLNPKSFINDYKVSTWRVGFLKRILGLRLPYYKINMKLRNVYLKEKNNNK